MKKTTKIIKQNIKYPPQYQRVTICYTPTIIATKKLNTTIIYQLLEHCANILWLSLIILIHLTECNGPCGRSCSCLFKKRAPLNASRPTTPLSYHAPKNTRKQHTDVSRLSLHLNFTYHSTLPVRYTK